MFVILSYDVNKKRDGRALKICRKYLVHIQKSVFEGNISKSGLDKLKMELESVLDMKSDSVCIYSMDSFQSIKKEQIGVFEDNSNIF